MLYRLWNCPPGIIRRVYWRIADAMLFPLAFIAALGAIENSYSYGLLGAWIYGESNCAN